MKKNNQMAERNKELVIKTKKMEEEQIFINKVSKWFFGTAVVAGIVCLGFYLKNKY